MTDLGVEIGFIGKFEFQGDIFYEYRSNILMDRSQVPATMGLQAPLRANVGEASARGVDMSLDFNHSFSNGFWLSLRANYTYVVSKFEKYEELDYVGAGLPWLSRVGNSLSQQ